MDTILQDLRFAARALWKQKALCLAGVMTLGVCVAATTTAFCILDAVILRPLPFDQPDRLVFLHNSYPRAGVDRSMTAVPDYFDRRTETSVFEEAAIFAVEGRSIGDPGRVERIPTMGATPSLFRVLRAQPFIGRAFSEQDGEVGQDRKVILSYRLWQRLFAGRPDVVGRDVRLNEVAHVVVGVMPAGFRFWDRTIEAWTPLAFTPQQQADENRHSNSYDMVARLAPGAGIGRARQVVDAINARNFERSPGGKQALLDAGFHTRVVPLQEFMVGDVRRILYLLWGGSLFVLMIGCVNMANLALVRASGRSKEMATRQALGASASRLARLSLTEAGVLAAAGGVAGLLLGRWMLTLVQALGAGQLPRGFEMQFDAAVFVYALAISSLVAVVVGLVPMAAMKRRALAQALGDEGRSGTSSRTTRFTRRMLVTAQVALALVLLAGSALLFSSFRKLLALDLGYRGEQVWTAKLNLPGTRYGGPASIVAFQSRLLEGVRALPGVTSAGLTSTLPFGGSTSSNVMLPEGYQPRPGEAAISVYRTSASPGYFEAMGIRLLRGRFFDDRDAATSARVVIIDDRLAKRFWPGEDPIGRRLWEPRDERLLPPEDDSAYCTIVGVVNAVRLTSPTGDGERVGATYQPFAQRPGLSFALVVRAAVTPGTLGAAMRSGVRAVDPELPLYDAQTMTERRDEAMKNRRTALALSVSFGVVALCLAALGLYGVLAYQVRQRRREIGIRMALGGRPAAIVRLVLNEGLVMVATGAGLGVAGVLLLGRVLRSELYGVQAGDPAIVGAMLAVVVVVALAACVIPARRAAQVDPTRALND